MTEQRKRAVIAKYIRSVRKNVKGLGPKHSKMFEIMDEEGFDLLPYIYSCMKEDYNLPQVIEKIRYPRASRSGIIDKDGNVTPVDFSEKADELEDQLLKYPAKGIRVFKPVKDNPHLDQNVNVPPEKR